MQALTVATAGHQYPIHLGAEVPEAWKATRAAWQQKGRPLFAIVDAGLAEAQANRINSLLGDMPCIVLPSGEATKSFAQLAEVCEAMAAARIDRQGAVVAVGGGVIGDLAGYAAASYLRGVPFFQIPTTLLAMVDSSVGGKTGINLRAGKNLVGAFHQPEAVFADFTLLGTLPAREFSAGMAEVIKYGLLADVALFGQLETLPTFDAAHPKLPAIVRRCCEIKAQVVAADEKEMAQTGGRALLNLGHTFAHAIEAIAGYGTYLHGEAVAIGLVCAARLSVELGWVEATVVDRTETLCARYALPVALREPLAGDALLSAMSRDKKVRAGKLRFVAMRALGEAVTVEDIEPALVKAIWQSVGAA